MHETYRRPGKQRNKKKSDEEVRWHGKRVMWQKAKTSLLLWRGICGTCSRSGGGRRGGSTWWPTRPGGTADLWRRCSPDNLPTWPRLSPAHRASARRRRRPCWPLLTCKGKKREVKHGRATETATAEPVSSRSYKCPSRELMSTKIFICTEIYNSLLKHILGLLRYKNIKDVSIRFFDSKPFWFWEFAETQSWSDTFATH